MFNFGFNSGPDSWPASGVFRNTRFALLCLLLCALCSGLWFWPKQQSAASVIRMNKHNEQVAQRQQREFDLRQAFKPASMLKMMAESRWTAYFGTAFEMPLRTPAFNTITVTTTADTVAVDGACSLREAIMAANTDTGVNECQAGAGPDIIQFALGAGTPTINLTSPLPVVTQPLEIFGDTGGSTRVRLNGAGAGAGAHGLRFTASTCNLTGLVISNFAGSGIRFEGNGEYLVQNSRIGTDATGTIAQGNNIGIFISGSSFLIGTDADGVNDAAEGNLISGNATCGIVIQDAGSDLGVVAGNFIGTDVTGMASLPNGDGIFISNGPTNDVIGTGGNIAGNNVSERNVISGNTGVGVRIDQASGNVVAGNYIGVNAAGTAALPNGGGGILFSLSVTNTRVGTNDDGVADDIERNVISGNTGTGIAIVSPGSTNNLVRGNYIGTNATGDAAIANSGAGLVINNAPGNAIGGAGGKRNTISGNGTSGVQINNAGATGNIVLSNLIGLNAAGTAGIPNSADGVFISGASGNSIGVIDQGNTIAFNGQRGVRIEGGTGNSIRDNLIFSNTGLGIDLGGDGVTPNDAGDPDAGANNLQNFPVITSVTSAGTLTGTLDSTAANSAYPVQLAFFANTTCDASGNGEGETALNLIGLAAPGGFTFNFAPIAGKPFITATATDSNGNTSEFSACKKVNTVPTIGAVNSTQQRGTIVNNVQIATVTDPDQPLNTLTVQINGAAAATVNGVTINNLTVDASGIVRASITTDCTTAANASFTLTVTDNVGESAMATLNITVTANTPPALGAYPNTGPINTGSNTTITPSTAPTDNGTVASLAASAPGFTGTFNGTPATGVITVANAGPAGNYTVTVTATDNCGAAATTTFTLAVNTLPAITAIANTRQQGSPVSNSQIATVTDPDQPANTLTVQVNNAASATVNGVTVSNLTSNAAGQVFADIVASCTATNASFTLKVTDNQNATATATLNVAATANTAPTLSYASSQTVLVGQALTVNPATGLSDNGTVASVIVQSAGTYTGTISVNSAGVVSLSNAKPTGSHLIAIQATDNCGLNITSTFTLNVNCQTITVTPPAINTGTAGSAFSQTFTQSGGIGATLFTTASALPTGITLASNGLLSGTPTQTGTFPITVKATDSNGCMGTANYTLTINCQTITVTNPGVNTGTAGVAFSQTFTQTGGIGATTFSTASALPTGITLLSGGLLSGTPTRTGAFPITVKATDSNGCMGTSATYTLTINCQTITVANPGVTSGTVGVAFSQTFTQSGGIGTTNFSTASTLPTGLTLASNGLLSGAPTQNGTFPLTVKATDSNGCMGTSNYTLTINCPAITVNPANLPNGTTGTNYSQTISATGGTSPYTFTVTSGLLPTGVTFAPGGAIGGAPTQSGTFNFTITATDANGCTGNRAYTLVIACPPFAININAPAAAVAGQNFGYDVAVTNPCPDVALDTTLTTSTPPNTTFQSINAPAGWTCTTPAVSGTGAISCNNANFLARVTTPRASATFTVGLKVNSGTPIGTGITNTANVTGTAPGRPPVSASASANTTVAIAAADLAVIKTATATAIAGTNFDYTINVTNSGPSIASNVSLTDTLPTNVTFQSFAPAAGWTCTTPAAGSTGTITCTKAAMATDDPGLFRVTVRLNANVACNTNIVNTATVTTASADPTPGNNSTTVTTQSRAQSDLSVSVNAPATAVPDTSAVYTVTVTNNGPSPSVNTTLNNALPAAFSAETITASTGSCTGIGSNSVNCNLGTLAAGATATVTIQAHVPETCQPTTAVNTATVTSGNCLSDPVAANNSQSKTTNVLLGNVGAGACVPATSAISADKPGSILFAGLALSGATAGGSGDSNQNNTRMNLTNVHPTLNVVVHLFFIDGATCSVADSFICLTANQTTSFLMSDLDPGTTGYMMMIAVDGPAGFAGGHNTGCPISFNYLIGNANIKFTGTPRRDADLGSESAAAQFGSPVPTCDPNSSVAELHFDGSPTGYNQLPGVLALDNFGSRADGNDTILAIGRIDGNWATGLQPIGPIFGLLYNDSETALSFSFNAGVCLFRQSLSNNFPRITPRLEQFIPAGRTGWLKLWSANGAALVGAAFTRNDNAQTSANAFEGGHNLHVLRLLPNAVITVPVFPPSC